jgi:hypothetical protein
MDEATRNRIIEEAHQTLERLNNQHEPRPELKPWKGPAEPEPPKRRERGLDTAEMDWSAVIDQRVGSMKDFVMEVVAASIAEVLRIEREHYASEMEKCDQRIGKLEVDLSQAVVAHERLNLKFLELSIEREREQRSKGIVDLPNPLLRRMN